MWHKYWEVLPHYVAWNLSPDKKTLIFQVLHAPVHPRPQLVFQNQIILTKCWWSVIVTCSWSQMFWGHHINNTILLGTYIWKFGHLNRKTASEMSNIRHYCNERRKKTAFHFWATSILKIWFQAVNNRRGFKRKGESKHTGFFRIYIPMLAWLVDTPEEHSRVLLPTSEIGEILFSHRPLLIWFERGWIQT